MDLLISYTKEDVREKEPWYTASGSRANVCPSSPILVVDLEGSK